MLTGCDDRVVEKLGEFLLFIVALVVVLLLFQVVAVVVLAVGAVKLARKTPSLNWGIAGIVCGLLELLPTVFSLLQITQPHPAHALAVLFVLGLLYVGIRNAMLAPPKVRGSAATISRT
jgi:hypothetical protein